MSNRIYASFADPDDAQKAVGALLDRGLENEHVSLVAHESYTRSRYGDMEHGQVDWNRYGSASSTSRMDSDLDTRSEYVDREEDDDDNPVESAEHGISTTTGGDAAAGAAKGAGIGLGVGVLAALASIFIPGFGLVTGAGALAAAIGGAAATTAAGAAAGGVYGYLRDQGVDDQEARHIEETFTGGGAVVEVTTGLDSISTAEIEQILRKYNATRVSSQAIAV